MKFNPNRRQILTFGTAGLAVATSPWVMAQTTNPTPAPQRSRYLINIMSFGGWDTSWHLSPLLMKDTAGLGAADLDQDFYGEIKNPRFPDDQGISFGGSIIGPALAAYKPDELSRMMIWRGLEVAAGHGFGNLLINDGHQSSYAASFSSIVADALTKAPDYLRVMHYVQIAGAPSDFSSQTGLMHGPGVPLNIPDSSIWTSLTAPDKNDPAITTAVKNTVTSAVQQLAGLTDNSKLKSTKELYEITFTNAFKGSESVRGRNLAGSPNFLQTFARYKQAVIDDLTVVLFSSAANSAVRAALSGLSGVPTAASGAQAFIERYLSLNNLVFPFALADFLVTNDLAAVVDVPAPGGDFHDGNDLDFLNTTAGLACFRALMRQLAATKAPDNSGSLLDSTLIVYSSEFDRTLARTAQNVGARPGTNHGATASVLMAGYGAAGGRIIGGRGTGTNGQFGGINRPFLQPLPIDPISGSPSASGQMTNQYSVLPTVLDIFGISIPSQQKTEWASVRAAIKPGHKA